MTALLIKGDNSKHCMRRAKWLPSNGENKINTLIQQHALCDLSISVCITLAFGDSRCQAYLSEDHGFRDGKKQTNKKGLKSLQIICADQSEKMHNVNIWKSNL